MIIKETKLNNITIVAPEGTLDASTVSLLNENKALSENSVTVVLDLSHVDFLDSSGLGALVGIARKKRGKKADMVLTSMNDNVRKVFEITHAYQLFDVYDDARSAAEHCRTKTASQ